MLTDCIVNVINVYIVVIQFKLLYNCKHKESGKHKECTLYEYQY